MTKDEQLKVVIKLLDDIRHNKSRSADEIRTISNVIYEEITAPKMETVEDTIFSVVFPEGNFHIFKTRTDADLSAAYGKGEVFEHVIKHMRPVEDKEPEVWEREVKRMHSIKVAIVYLPDELVGKTVEVRLKEEE